MHDKHPSEPTLTPHDLPPHQRKCARPPSSLNYTPKRNQLVVLGAAFGVLMGPHCANPRSLGHRTQEITLEVMRMRIVLATGLPAASVVFGGPCEGVARDDGVRLGGAFQQSYSPVTVFAHHPFVSQ